MGRIREQGRAIMVFVLCLQNKDGQEKEVKKFDGTGYDKDLVEALERDIISQNPNVKWYVRVQHSWETLCVILGNVFHAVFVVNEAQCVPVSSCLGVR